MWSSRKRAHEPTFENLETYIKRWVFENFNNDFTSDEPLHSNDDRQGGGGCQKIICQGTLKKVSSHLWYSSPEPVRFAFFDDTIQLITKKNSTSPEVFIARLFEYQMFIIKLVTLLAYKPDDEHLVFGKLHNEHLVRSRVFLCKFFPNLLIKKLVMKTKM